MSKTKDAPVYTVEQIEAIKKNIKSAYSHVIIREEQTFYEDISTTIEIRLKHKVVDK